MDVTYPLQFISANVCRYCLSVTFLYPAGILELNKFIKIEVLDISSQIFFWSSACILSPEL